VQRVEFAILGPLEIRDGDRTLPVAGTKQRALLAALLVHRGEVVPPDRLAQWLWADEQPVNPRNALQSQIAQLRRTLGPSGRTLLVSRPPGYVLDVDDGDLDAAGFERDVEAARAAAAAGDSETARQRLDVALARWRGPALVDVADQAFATATVARLEQLRAAAREERIEAGLAAGRHAELVPELEALVAEHPLRERLRAQLMLALYRCGRQAEALEVFHDARRVLDEELGVDPGPELTRRHEAVLRQEDPDAPPPSRAGASTGPQVADAPPGGGLARRRRRLPATLTSFVGRGAERDQLLALLHHDRLVTLTGPGGVGKTRLALETAHALQRAGGRPGGVWFVELAAIQDPDLVPQVVADALGLTDDLAPPGTGSPQRDALDRVVGALASAPSLLVLDNCEHLLGAAAALVRTLLTDSADAHVLTTSREPLGLTGETIRPVPVLPVPGAGAADPPDELARVGAVRLFIDRVRASDPTFVLDETTGPAVAELCRALDGIPLAIELAASRVRTLGLEPLLARLDDRFRVLTAGDRTADARQRTLRAVVDWSWDLLEDAERVLLRRLSVFTAGATVDAANAVAGDPIDLGGDAGTHHLGPATGADHTGPADDAIVDDAIVDLLARLVDRSMLLLDVASSPVRYRMLETIRSYAAEKLDAAGERAAIGARHADHLLGLARRTVPQLRDHRQLAAMALLDATLEEFRSALSWCRTTGDTTRGVQLATELGWYWYLRGHRVEGVRWLAAFADADAPREVALGTLWRAFLAVEDLPPGDHAELFAAALDVLAGDGTDADRAFGALVAAELSAVLGDRRAVDRHLAAARAAADAADDDGYRATAAFVAGHAALLHGEVVAAIASIDEALTAFVAVGDRWGQVQCRIALAGVAETTGDAQAALAHVDAGLGLARELELRELEGILHTRHAMLAAALGRPEAASAAVGRADAITAELGSDVLRVNADLAAGVTALRSGQLDDAERRLRRALGWLASTPHPALRAYALARLAGVAELRGREQEAIGLARHSVEVARATQDPRTVALALETLAAAVAAAQHGELAARLLGAADRHREALGPPLPDSDPAERDRVVAALGVLLPPGGGEHARAAGRDAPLDELLAGVAALPAS
jgi:predicted ATPase/DNA-binding SARP family transcriptional activator